LYEKLSTPMFQELFLAAGGTGYVTVAAEEPRA
jgi:hypothetical protein